MRYGCLSKPPFTLLQRRHAITSAVKTRVLVAAVAALVAGAVAGGIAYDYLKAHPQRAATNGSSDDSTDLLTF